jgi:hypothetical protein
MVLRQGAYDVMTGAYDVIANAVKQSGLSADRIASYLAKAVRSAPFRLVLMVLRQSAYDVMTGAYDVIANAVK